MGVRTLTAPPGVAGLVYGASGAIYVPDANGMIQNVQATDIGPLVANGWIVSIEPSGLLTQFGGAALLANNSAFTEEGNLYRAVGNPVGANAAALTDTILAGIVLPAGAFDIAGRGLYLSAQGMAGATANNKRAKIFLNPTMSGQTVSSVGVISGGVVTAGTPIADSGAWTTGNNNVGWGLYSNVFKYGAAGSNTQFVQSSPVLGATHGGMSAVQFLTLVESAVINIVVTGSSYTTGAANDILLQLFEVNAMN